MEHEDRYRGTTRERELIHPHLFLVPEGAHVPEERGSGDAEVGRGRGQPELVQQGLLQRPHHRVGRPGLP